MAPLPALLAIMEFISLSFRDSQGIAANLAIRSDKLAMAAASKG
jgi:hypothetical protein